MIKADLIRELEKTKEKLIRALRRAEGLKQKSAVLGTQYVDSHEREKHSNELVMMLLERQRELNVMLNRSNIMLNRAHEAMALTSVEFNEIAKALPEPKKAEWSDRISKINDLFKQSGIQDGDVLGLEGSEPPSLNTDEMTRESQEAFGRKDSIWSSKEAHEPSSVESELLPEYHSTVENHESEIIQELEPVMAGESDTQSKPASVRKPWWHRVSSE
ncbi:MAG: hypothetical protein NT018_02685 [Armatimonadetes bacterium]|nr:hypothetical protein [Armatimonadota bacterium]